MSLSEMFHVGIVVPNLESACAHFTELLGIVWGPVIESEVAARDGEGNDLVFPNRICYSTEAPYLELIEEQPGTPWVCNEHSNLHHIGFFSGALVADSAHLAQARCPLEICGRDDSGAPAVFTYHRDPLGVRLEYVDAVLRTTMEAFIFKPPAAV
jgi:hypothetical protein